jgi:PAS domain S-box-containing protein
MNWSRFLPQSIKAKVTSFVLVIFMLSLWTLTLYISHALRQDMERMIGEQQTIAARYVAVQINEELKTRMDALKQVAASIPPPLVDDAASMRAFLKALTVLQHMFDKGTFVTRQGDAHAMAGDAIVAALQEGKTGIGQPVLDESSRVPLLSMATPVRDARGKVIAALAGSFHLSNKSFLDDVATIPQGEHGGYVLLVAPQYRMVVTSSDPRRIMSTLPAPGVNPVMDRFIQRQEETGILINPEGMEVLAATVAVPVADWYVALMLPTRAAFAPITAMQQNMLAATALLTLIMSALTWWLIRRQLAPMLATIEAIAAGSGPDHLPNTLPNTRQDETGALIGSFNRLLEALHGRERKLEENLASFRKTLQEVEDLYNNAATGYHSVDADGALLRINDTELKWLGYRRDEIVGRKKVQDLLTPASREIFHQNFPRFVADGLLQEIELDMVCKDGSILPTLVSASAVRDEAGRFQMSRTTVYDLTEQRKTGAALRAARDAAENANRAKSRFLAAASHDLRQPLSALALYVGVLKGRMTEANSDLVHSIQDCVDSLSNLLGDLLDVSKLDAGVITPQPSDFAMDELLATLVSIHGGEAGLKGLALRSRRSRLMVRTDPQLLHRMLGNLVANAIRYTEKGGILIACRRHQGKAWVEVWDTGIGIAASDQGIIFEEFRQLGDDSRRRGSGLGLAIVARTAELLGLALRVRSRPGFGSMFAVELPPGRSLLPASAAAVGPGRPARIGLIEDNPEVLKALALALEEADHEVIAAASTAQLLERLGHRSPNLIISDYRLADNKTGVEAIATLRARFGEQLPAILITGDTDPALLRNLTEHGIVIHFKPIQMESLKAFIVHATERKGQ